MRSLKVMLAGFLLVANTQSFAQWRSLDVPADKGWQHAQTGLVLWGKFGAFERVSLRDRGTAELDIATNYRTADGKSTASIFLYRPGFVDVPLWFDRSHSAMLLNPQIKAGASATGVTRFAAPRGSPQSALRIVYPLAGRSEGATGLAMIPFGDWLVAVRLSSDTMTAAALDIALVELVGKMKWPASIAPAKIANPVLPCPSKLKYKRAKPVQPDLAQVMLASVIGLAVQNKKSAPGFVAGNLPDHCLEANAGAEYSVYRSAASTTHYVIAIGDAGAAAFVGPEFSLTGDKGRYGVMLVDHDSSDTYPAFSAMPSPDQVVGLVKTTRAMTSGGRDNTTISIAPGVK